MTDQFMILDIYIDPEELKRLYDGSAKFVHTVARDGRSVRFPLNLLQPFVTRSGIRGSFKIRFDANHKFKKIDRI